MQNAIEMTRAAAESVIEIQDVQIGRSFWGATIHPSGNVSVYCDGEYQGLAAWDADKERLVGDFALCEEEGALDRAIAKALDRATPPVPSVGCYYGGVLG